MSVRTKGRRKIVVNEKEYIWYVKEDFDSPYMILNVCSIDKKIILAIPLKTQVSYVISKGIYFQGRKTSGNWERYKYDLGIPESITPIFVKKCIEWAVDGRDAEKIEWNGYSIPV